MKQHRFTWIILLAFVAASAALGYVLLRPTAAPANVATVRVGTIQATVNALGRVQPVRQVSLSARASGAVRAIHVREGDNVAAGALLLELDDWEYQAALADARRTLALREQQLEAALQAPDSAAIAVARAQLRRATVSRQAAQEDYDAVAETPGPQRNDRAVDLESAKVEYELAQAEFDRVMEGTSDADLERLHAEVETAQQAVQAAEHRLAWARVEAPFAGTVMQILPEVGENVGGYNPMLVLADLTDLEVQAEVDELDIASVREGQPVRITLDAFPAQAISGTLQQLMPGISDTRGTTTYRAIIRLVAPIMPLRPGMGANVTFITEMAENALLVPRRAVRQVGQHQVVRLQEGRSTREVIVITGLSNDGEIQIMNGLEPAQKVVLD
jgi:RND family efflux transporter MFP subunit